MVFYVVFSPGIVFPKINAIVILCITVHATTHEGGGG